MTEYRLLCQREQSESVICCMNGEVFSRLPALLKNYPQSIIFTDSNVFEIYGGQIKSACPNLPVHVMQAGEENKTAETLFALLSQMAECGMHRNGCIVALGGGVVGDIGGLASALYMRGIDCIQVPTTLLSQVDSSVGGKTAVDLGKVKNLVGAFKQPNYVLADSEFFATLPRRELRCGLGEIVKHGALNGELFDILTAQEDLFDLRFLHKIVPMNIAHKARVVEEDEKEAGLRKSLNLGHTTAHAFELCDQKLSHGEYVLIGTIFEAELAKKYTDCDGEYLQKLQTLCWRALEERPALAPASEVAPFAKLDKKNSSSACVTVTAPVRKGEYALLQIPYEEYASELCAIQRRLNLC